MPQWGAKDSSRSQTSSGVGCAVVKVVRTVLLEAELGGEVAGLKSWAAARDRPFPISGDAPQVAWDHHRVRELILHQQSGQAPCQG